LISTAEDGVNRNAARPARTLSPPSVPTLQVPPVAVTVGGTEPARLGKAHA